ncbi:MAG: hypothetical protein QM690_02525 [Sphingobium sp.]
MAGTAARQGKPLARGCWTDAGIIALATVALRIWWVGNPHIHVDEEFYLLVGGRMLDGALPYIDIWDRKPFGLFLIYAVAALFGDGVAAYQLMAMLFTFGTAMLVYGMSRRFADRPTAILAAVAYGLLLNLFEGMGGQAPVFYNLFVTAAAAIAMSLFLDRDGLSRGRLLLRGAALMLLMGIAIQIKYAAIGEAVFFGLFLQWLAWRRWGLGLAIGGGLLWAAMGLGPSILIWLYYVWLGAGDIFVYANITSTLDRGSDPLKWVVGRFISIVRVLAIPAVIGLWGAFTRGPDGTKPVRTDIFRFAAFWNAAAWSSFLAFGTYFPHYALSLAAPTALLFAFASGNWLKLRAAVVVIGALISLDTVRHDVGGGGGGKVITDTLAAMGPSPNCPYMYEGSPMLYHLGGYCLPSRYPFPYHLTIVREHDALGIDPDRELARILSRNPYYIVARFPFSEEHNPKSDRLLSDVLKARYTPVMSTRQWKLYDVTLFRLKPQFRPLPNGADYSGVPPIRGR